MSGTATVRRGNPVLRATLIWSSITTAALAVVGGAVGVLVAGLPGLASALAGVVAAGAFLAITVLSILAAQRWFGRPDQIAAYFGLIIGGWALKLVVFVAVLLVLRDQPWVQGYVFFGAVLASVVSSLVVDLVAFARVRVPYVGDIALPGPVEDDRPAS